MYFTYAQGWLYVVVRAFVHDAVLRRPKVWDKTPRFATSEPPPLDVTKSEPVSLKDAASPPTFTE